MIKDGGFARKSKTGSNIPSSSLADMAFLLLIFFMVTTVFRKEEPRDVIIPQAQAAEKVDESRKYILNVYVERDGTIFINDLVIPAAQVSAYVQPLYEASDQRLVVSIRGDREVPYHHVDAIMKQLQAARAVRVNFYTHLEQRIVRERR